MRIVIDLQSCQSDNQFRGIGRYSMALARAIARQAGTHEVWLMLSDRFPESIPFIRSEFEGLVPKDQVKVIALNGPLAECHPNNSWRARSAEKIREYFLAGLKPDIVHVTSLFEGFEQDVVASIGAFEQDLQTAVTLYDQIPLFDQGDYFSDPRYKEYYFQRLSSLKNANLLLTPSEFTKQNAVAALGFQKVSIVNISVGVEACFKQKNITQNKKKALFDRYNITKQIIMFAPDRFDDLQNITGFLKAFSHLDPDLQETHQVVITGKPYKSTYSHMVNLAKAVGLEQDSLILTGYVPDEDLIALYNLCKLSVIPSLHEGSGLPALEAMACGAPVIASNASSLPEVIGRTDALFDPAHPDTITRMIQNVLTNEEFRLDLRDHGLAQAKKFTWDEAAKKAIAAFESLQEQNSKNERSSAKKSGAKPRLAFISPLPPEKTGISEYSAELIPELARYYDITLIVDQPKIKDPLLADNFPVKDVAWFDVNAGNFDRILYQFGNSPFHKHMFALLDRHPGVIVLHDFFLGHAIHWMEAAGYAPAFFRQSIYFSHGYSGLSALDRLGVEMAKWTYPCNKSILDQADGVIVHSQYSIQAAQEWYGVNTASKFKQILQLHSLPEKADRTQARARIGIKPDDFLVCSFGSANLTKLNHRLLDAWLGSSLAQDKNCHLVFVGENDSGDYGKMLLDKIAGSGLVNNISITGFVSRSRYQEYLEAADAVVQLRSISRGETSRSVLDVLANGLALIVNAHGTMAEYPDDVLIKLTDDFSNSDLINALDHLYKDPVFRKQVSTAGKRYIAKFHNPEKIAEEYQDAIEYFTGKSPRTHYKTLVNSLAGISARVMPGKPDLALTAVSIADNDPQERQKQIFVDVSVLAQQDLQTGIERVTRSVLMQILHNPPEGFRIEPVYCSGNIFRYARRFTTKILGIGETGLHDDVIDIQQSDIFLGLDWNPGISSDMFRSFISMGVKIFFVVHDILPVSHPEYFPPNSSAHFSKWLETIAEVANGLVCVSRSTAEDLNRWLNANPPIRVEPLSIGYSHNGADIENSSSTTGIPEKAEDVLKTLKSAPTFLMVGTIEPRKGYSQALSAFDKLWSENREINLVIVGKEGWKQLDSLSREKIIEISNKIRNHEQYGRHLFWLEGISDGFLERIYSACTCLLAASEAEGFGLPLVEAARNKLPILARDIPVFREVAGDHACFFNGMLPEDLAQAMETWLELFTKGNAPSSVDMHWLSWRDSSTKLLENILDSKWYLTWVSKGPKDHRYQDGNIGFDISRIMSINCCADGNLGQFEVHGFSASESDHTWTKSRKATLGFKIINSELLQTDLNFIMDVHGFTYILPYQRVTIFANSQIVYAGNIGSDYSSICFPIPKELVQGRHILELMFEMPDASSSAIDPRILGLSFRSISIMPIG